MTLFINRTYERQYNVKRIRRHMRDLGVSSAIRRKKKNYLRYKPEQVGENILNREFTASKPNEKWLTDVTEYKIIGSTKKLYLSAILDLYDNSIVAYRMGLSNNNDLVFKTFDDAIKAYPNVIRFYSIVIVGFNILIARLRKNSITLSLDRVCLELAAVLTTDQWKHSSE